MITHAPPRLHDVIQHSHVLLLRGHLSPQGFWDHLSPQRAWGSFVPPKGLGIICPPKGFGDYLSPQRVWGSFVPPKGLRIICPPKFCLRFLIVRLLRLCWSLPFPCTSPQLSMPGLMNLSLVRHALLLPLWVRLVRL